MSAQDSEITVSGHGTVNYDTDLEAQNEKKDGVTVTATERPILGRRKTTGSLAATGVMEQAETLAYDAGEDALTKIGNFFMKIHSASVITRYALYILPVAAILAVPVIVFSTTKYAPLKADGIRLLGLFIWIEIIWLALWVCKLMTQAMPILFLAVCGLISTGIRKYSLVLKALEIPMSLFLWSAVSYATTDAIWMFNKDEFNSSTNPRGDWVRTLKKVWVAGMIVCAVFLVQKFIMQMISINYHRKQYDLKIKESKKLIRLLDLLYDASRRLFPEFGKDFIEEDAIIQDSGINAVRIKMNEAGMRTNIFNDVHRVKGKVTAAFGAMASDVTGQQLFNATNAHSIVLKALETEAASNALARRLWLSFAAHGEDALYKQDIIEVLGTQRTQEAEEIFHTLDRDDNGDVSLEEMTMLIVTAGNERRDRATSMQDISQAIAVLDRLLSLVVIVAIAFIYATFFSKNFAAKTTQLWTSFTGLAFAIGGTVTEFLACCIFLFVKHPYDVGDRVNIDGHELIVKHISLMYSVFQKVADDGVVQIPHSTANNLWIENVSRSRSMKERLRLNVAATTKMEDILALKSEMEKFISADENRRDFLEGLDIELMSVGDMKSLELRVEVRHKSNWSNEMLRNHRRNKFMCELLSVMRRVPIEPPGGSGAPLGDPSNPGYSVSVTDAEAASARAAKAEKVASARLYPAGTKLEEFVPTAAAATATAGMSGFLTPAQAMFPGLKQRVVQSQALDLSLGQQGFQGRRESAWSKK